MARGGGGAAVRLLPGADTGTRRFHYLSHAVSKAYRERHMPHQVALQPNTRGDGLPTLAYSKFPLAATRTGHHPPPCSRRRRVKSDLDTFGPGVELYFKFLKFAAVLFGVMSLLSIPAMVLFYSGDAMATSAASSGSGQASYVSALSLLSLGNLGDATTVYGDAHERDGADVTLACPAGMKMLRIEAFYGDLSGSLGCPARQTPSGASKLACDDTLSGDACLPGPGTPSRPVQAPYYCHLSNNRPVRLPSRTRFMAGPCCAAQLLAGREDFSALDVNVVGGCEASRARVTAIASGMCLGSANCTLSPARGAAHVWTPSRDFYSACPGALLDTRRACSETWLGAADASFERCSATASNATEPTSSAAFRARGARLVVMAKCFTETIRPSWWLGASEPLSKQTVALVVIGFELLIALTFMAGWALLTQREGQAVFPSAQITAANYTLMLTSLPPHDDIKQLEVDLRTHLENALSAAPSVSRSDLPRIAVADVNFALRNTDLIDLFTLRGELLHQIERLSKVALLAERSMSLPPRRRWGWGGGARGVFGGSSAGLADASPRVDEAQHERFSRTVQYVRLLRTRLDALDVRIDTAEARVVAAAASRHPAGSGSGGGGGGDSGNGSERAWWPGSPDAGGRWQLHKSNKEPPPVTAVAAFVTFEEEEGVLRARAAFPDDNLWGWLCQRRELRLRGVHRVSMARAPEPSDIRWENYRLGPCQQLSRRATTAVLLLAVLLASAYGIFAADGARRLAAKTYPDVNCAATFKDSVGDRALVQQELLAGDAAGKSSVGVSGRLGCYCKNLLATRGVSAVFSEEFLVGTTTETLCVTWFQNFVSVNALIYGVSLVVLVFNIALRVIISALVSFERHTTVSSEVRVRASYLLLVQFVNTGVLVTLLNAYIDTDFVLLRGGQFWDFSAGWYSTVGTSLMLTMLLQVATIHLSPLLYGSLKSMRRCWDRRLGCDRAVTRVKTQGELNELYLGIEFALDERYAQLYTATFVILMYSSGLPLLMPVLAATFTVTYAVDKVLFLRAYNTPPYFDETLGRRLTSLLPIAMLAHVSFGIWQLSSADLFPGITSLVGFVRAMSGDTTNTENLARTISDQLDTEQIKIGERLSTWHVIPLSILLALLVAMLVWQHLLLGLLQRFGSVFCCCAAASIERCLRSEPQAEGLPNYFMAIPPDVIDEVTSGSRRVKPYLAKKLADMRTAHQAVREKATLTTLLSSYERLNSVLGALKALRVDVQAQADAFERDVHAICDAGAAAATSSASLTPRGALVSRGSERSLVLRGDSSDHAPPPAGGPPGEPSAVRDNSAALASALRMYARNASARMGGVAPRRTSSVEPRAAVPPPAETAVDMEAAGGDAGDAHPAAATAAAATRPRRASLSVVPVDGHGGAHPSFEYSNPSFDSARGGGVVTDVAAVAVAVGDDDVPADPDAACDASIAGSSAASVAASTVSGSDGHRGDDAPGSSGGSAHGAAAACAPRAPSTPRDSSADNDGVFAVTPGVLAQLRIPLDDDASPLGGAGEPAGAALALAAEEGGSAEEGGGGDVLAVPRARLLSPSTLTDVHALRERLLGSLTLPPECSVRITLPEAAEHARQVLGTLDYVLARVGNRGLQLYQHISRGIDRKNAQRAQFASGGAAATLDSAMSFLVSRLSLSRRALPLPLRAPPPAAAAAAAAAAGATTAEDGAGGGPSAGAPTAAGEGAPSAGRKPRKSLLQRLSLGGDGGRGTTAKGGRDRAASSSSSSAAGSHPHGYEEVDIVDRGLIVGVWCYDLQEAPRLRRRFGLEAAVASALKRRMGGLDQLRGRGGVGATARAIAAGNAARKPAPHQTAGATMESVADATTAPATAAAARRTQSRVAGRHAASPAAGDAAWASHVVAAAGRSSQQQPPPTAAPGPSHRRGHSEPVGYSSSGYPLFAPSSSSGGDSRGSDSHGSGGGGGSSRGGGGSRSRSGGSGSRADEPAAAAAPSSRQSSAPSSAGGAARGGQAAHPALLSRAGSFGGGARAPPASSSGYTADAGGGSSVHIDSLDASAAYVGGELVSQLPSRHRHVYPDQHPAGRRAPGAAAPLPPR